MIHIVRTRSCDNKTLSHVFLFLFVTSRQKAPLKCRLEINFMKSDRPVPEEKSDREITFKTERRTNFNELMTLSACVEVMWFRRCSRLSGFTLSYRLLTGTWLIITYIDCVLFDGGKRKVSIRNPHSRTVKMVHWNSTEQLLLAVWRTSLFDCLRLV